MSAAPGTLNTYKYRDVPFAVWFDLSRVAWCLDLQQLPQVYPAAQGRIVCDIPNAAQAVLVGKQIIEDVWRASRMVPALPPAPAPSLQLPSKKSKALSRKSKAKHWQQKAQQRTLPDPRTKPKKFEATRQAIKTISNKPFTRSDLAQQLSIVEQGAGVVMAQLEQFGYVRFYDSRGRVEAGRSPRGYVRYFVLTPEGQQWVDQDVPTLLVSDKVRQALVALLDQPTFVRRDLEKHSVGGTRYTVTVLNDLRQYGFVELAHLERIPQGGNIPHYAFTPKGRQWLEVHRNPIAGRVHPAALAAIILGVGLLTAGITSKLLSKSAAPIATPSNCPEQSPQPFLVRTNYLKDPAMFTQAVNYRTQNYGYFPGFGNPSLNAHPPSYYAARTTFFGLPVVLNRRIIPALKCVEAAIKAECVATPYQPKALSGLRMANTYHNYEVSNHVYGIAIDIDPALNPCCGCVGHWAQDPICAQPDTGLYSRMSMPECWVHIFERYGFYWLGHDYSLRDTMHFEFLGDPDLLPSYNDVVAGAPNDPVPLVATVGLEGPPLETTSLVFPASNLQITAEVAHTTAEQAEGLAHRATLAPNHGMLFVFSDSSAHGFWMHETQIPLDILFLDEHFTIVGILENMQPGDLTLRRTGQPSRYALEVNAGFIRRHGIYVGQHMVGVAQT